MEKFSKIKQIKYVKGWQGKEQLLFFHEIKLENGDEGKLGSNTQENPSWLQNGVEIHYSIVSSARGNIITLISVISGPMNGAQSGQAPYNIPNSNVRKVNQEPEAFKKQSYGTRLDSDPDFRLRQQKCISLTTCLDRANELVIAGKIKLADKHTEAMGDFKFIMRHAGIILTEEIEPTRAEVGNAHDMGDSWGHPSQAALFDTLVDDELISPILESMLDRCTTTKHLANFKTQLSEGELGNKSVMSAIKAKESEIKSKK